MVNRQTVQYAVAVALPDVAKGAPGFGKRDTQREEKGTPFPSGSQAWRESAASAVAVGGLPAVDTLLEVLGAGEPSGAQILSNRNSRVARLLGDILESHGAHEVDGNLPHNECWELTRTSAELDLAGSRVCAGFAYRIYRGASGRPLIALGKAHGRAKSRPVSLARVMLAWGRRWRTVKDTLDGVQRIERRHGRLSQVLRKKDAAHMCDNPRCVCPRHLGLRSWKLNRSRSQWADEDIY